MRFLSFSALYIFLGLVIGLGSAMQALNGTGLQAVKSGNGWQAWRLSSNDRFLPYSLGHFLNNGELPPPKSAFYYVRSTDDDGNALRGDCVFKVEGPALASRWWSLSAGVERAAVLSAGEAVLDSKSNLKVIISRHPQPGNWIVPSGNGRYTLTYILSEPTRATDTTVLQLPYVKKVGC
jgi:hypothetical protein